MYGNAILMETRKDIYESSVRLAIELEKHLSLVFHVQSSTLEALLTPFIVYLCIPQRGLIGLGL